MTVRRLSLRVPGTPEHLTILRSFAGALGRVLGATSSEIDDLKLAVTELATAALPVAPASPRQVGTELTLEVFDGSDGPYLRVGGSSSPSLSAATRELLARLYQARGWIAEDPWLIRLPAG